MGRTVLRHAPIDEVVRRHILAVVDDCRTLKRASEILGMSKTTLWRRLREYGVKVVHDVPDHAEEFETIAKPCGVTVDEVRAVLGQITDRELARRAGLCRETARRRRIEAAELLKMPPGHWGEDLEA